ncbi:MAG: branched-chain amino acid ABC transporter permease [Alphaproteobacteria bacterium]|jgi:branched-chain amino acid transport system permease protein|nr:branched-chain amino acid ABC transporter permease [Alphaproteobacteria bacterium]MDP6516342.1 branched-chain amino acid ABC transporter permease [Alphaproteobacteria bacterium]
MRFLFKTDYDQDIRLFKHGGTVFWYGLLMVLLVLAPLALDEYLLSQLSFVFIYAVAGVGLMLLAGYTGQISLGHAAFFAAGSYTEAVLFNNGVPFLISLPAAGLLAGALGVVIGLPALRLAGIYLAIATLAFAFIIEEILARWESVTNGNNGMLVDSVEIGGFGFDQEWRFYYLCLAVLVLVILASINILRAPLGRAMIAVRDSEIAAQSMGVNLAKTKTVAFAISAAFTGLAGALYAHRLTFISPESYTIFLSIELLLVVVVGGLGSLHGAVFGAIFVIVLPQLIVILKDILPAAIAEQTGLQAGMFGIIIVLFMLFEPLGLYGRWVKIKLYFSLFPLYKRATFKRQKSYLRTDQLR